MLSDTVIFGSNRAIASSSFSPRDNVISWTETYTLFELNDDNRGLVKNGRIQVSPTTMQLKAGK
jgi:hypothetical protein